MKHLKTYENIKIDKKYVLTKSDRSDIPYYILFVVNTDNSGIFYNGYACYIDDSKELFIAKENLSRKPEFISNKNLESTFKLIYQTDSFEDAKEKLDLQFVAKKYNI